MNSRRAKWLKKLVRNFDLNLLLTVRKIYGEKTSEMKEYELYQKAKKIWGTKIKETKTWGNKIKGES